MIVRILYAIILAMSTASVLNQMEPSEPRVRGYIVLLSQTELGTPRCTGTLFAREYIVTLAQCVKNAEWATVDDTPVQIIEKTRHPRNDPTQLAYDVAVLRLRKPTKQRPFPKFGFDFIEPGTMVTSLRNGTRPPSAAKVQPIANCDNTIKTASANDNNTMCVADVTICSGDAGSPLIALKDGRGVLVAMSSLVRELCTPSISTYARLSAARDFLEAYLEPRIMPPPISHRIP
ncbi:hypothetical protein Ae201684P_019736 [Aphanomyces euteiches]|uniref:Peptidase S1 domain-containing protein n=1 Tax=Aphanomyces euteiches TaxID=100861 RepID=A0A6G0WDD6_9STRA|nr:hypothetical protein Ae201684_016049 [Aphanomyces euteiches]KAH9078658.1 hypothetical protein Ae201684P_019736 [Aphanomyces euteiches]